MRNRVFILFVLFFLTSFVYAQRKKESQQQAPVSGKIFTSPKSPALPIEAGIELYRMKEKVLYLNIKNNYTRPIKKVICSIRIIDIIRMKAIHTFDTIAFEFAVAVSPGSSFIAIKDEASLPALKNDNLTYSKCRGYEYKKDKDGSWDSAFVPDRCSQDAFTIIISGVEFTDNSVWYPPVIYKAYQNAEKSISRLGEEDKLKLNQLARKPIKESEFGQLWAFLVPEGELACKGKAVLFMTKFGKNYAINGWAVGVSIDGIKVSTELPEVVSDMKKLDLFKDLETALCTGGIK